MNSQQSLGQTPLGNILNSGSNPQVQMYQQTAMNNIRTKDFLSNWLKQMKTQTSQQSQQPQQSQPNLALGNPNQAPSAQMTPQTGADGHEWNGLCEAYVEQQKFGTQGIYPSAVAAWDQSKNKVAGLQGIQPGDQIFFAPDQSNGGFGHTGIYEGNNQFTSATYNGVQSNDLAQWQQNTGQQLLGYTAE